MLLVAYKKKGGSLAEEMQNFIDSICMLQFLRIDFFKLMRFLRREMVFSLMRNGNARVLAKTAGE